MGQLAGIVIIPLYLFTALYVFQHAPFLLAGFTLVLFIAWLGACVWILFTGPGLIGQLTALCLTLTVLTLPLWYIIKNIFKFVFWVFGTLFSFVAT